jgi:iron complex outermembrane receptor protein
MEMRQKLALLLLSATSLTGSVAFAQSSAPSVSATEATQVEEVIVTVQRRSESLQKVPVSVTAVTAENLERRRLSDLTQISQAAPSLQIGQDATFSVRGVGTLAFAGTIDSSVALALDEVNLGRPFLGGPKFNDVERVEVLNGPQGLLFGKNASAGLLNIVTTRPVLGDFGGTVDFEALTRATPGSSRKANGVQARGTVNIPVSENSALRINALYADQEAPTTYVGKAPAGTRQDLDLKSTSIKAKYLIEPNDKLSVYLIGDYNETHGVAGQGDRTYIELDSTSVNLPALTADGIVASEDNFEFGGDGAYWRDLITGGAQAKVAYLLDSGIEVSNLVAWRYYDQDQQYDIDTTSQNGANVNHTVARYDQYSNEFRVALPTGARLGGQAGLYYFKSTLDLQGQIGGNNYLPGFVAAGYPFCVGATATPGAPPPACSVSNKYFLGSDKDYQLDTLSYAAFGQLTYDATEALKLIGGARLTRDEIDLHLVQGQVNYFTPLGGPRGTIDRSYGNTDFSWKIGAQYQATPKVMAYGFFGRGYKGPGFNDTAPTLTTSLVVEEETSKTAEVGVKSSFFENRLVVNVSAFHTKFDNFQVQSFDPVTRSYQVQNAASVISKGAEATVSARPVRGLTLNATAALLDSKFDQFAGAQCYPTQTTHGCSATVNMFDASGLTLPVSPKFTGSLQALYEFPSQGAVTPFVEGNLYHRSKINYLINQAPGATVDAIDILGASVGAQVGENLRVSLFCKNCTNEISPTSIGTDAGDASARNNRGQATPKLSYTRQVSMDAVRNIGLALTYKF